MVARRLPSDGEAGAATALPEPGPRVSRPISSSATASTSAAIATAVRMNPADPDPLSIPCSAPSPESGCSKQVLETSAGKSAVGRRQSAVGSRRLAIAMPVRDRGKPGRGKEGVAARRECFRVRFARRECPHIDVVRLTHRMGALERPVVQRRVDQGSHGVTGHATGAFRVTRDGLDTRRNRSGIFGDAIGASDRPIDEPSRRVTDDTPTSRKRRNAGLPTCPSRRGDLAQLQPGAGRLGARALTVVGAIGTTAGRRTNNLKHAYGARDCSGDLELLENATFSRGGATSSRDGGRGWRAAGPLQTLLSRFPSTGAAPGCCARGVSVERRGSRPVLQRRRAFHLRSQVGRDGARCVHHRRLHDDAGGRPDDGLLHRRRRGRAQLVLRVPDDAPAALLRGRYDRDCGAQRHQRRRSRIERHQSTT